MFINRKCKENFKDIYAVIVINVFGEEEYIMFSTTKKNAQKIIDNIQQKIDVDFNIELKIKKLSGKIREPSIKQIETHIISEGERFNKGMNPFE